MSSNEDIIRAETIVKFDSSEYGTGVVDGVFTAPIGKVLKPIYTPVRGALCLFVGFFVDFFEMFVGVTEKVTVKQKIKKSIKKMPFLLFSPFCGQIKKKTNNKVHNAFFTLRLFY